MKFKMDFGTDDSVYNLITKLCEKFYNEPSKVRESRKKCYEILLGKRLPKYKKVFADLKESSDPVCLLLSWQFTLSHAYDLKDHAIELKNCVDQFQKECDKPDDFNNILYFLLQLRNVPSKADNKLDLSTLPPINDFENFNKLFRLPADLLNESALYYNSTVLSDTTIIQIPNKPTQSSDEVFEEIYKDEGYYSPSSATPPNIWELAATLKFSNRRNWENYGLPEPDKERPFLSELGDLSSLWVENLDSLYFSKLYKDGTVYNSRMVPRKIFIRDLKYLLVGVASETFGFKESGEFYLIPNVTVEGITPDTLNTYCADLLFCGTCCKALNRIITPLPDTGDYKYQGFIFKEFCDSVSCYLEFYRTAVFSIPDSANYLYFSEKTYQLQTQVSVLASICKVGPYTESEEIPHGVALLNYLYQKVLSLTDQTVVTVLYSILYPCCQVYFSRFLKQWIMGGVIDDPYGEFFIKKNSKSVHSLGRPYWTKSYSVRHDMVPDFLLELGYDVLCCGRAMNLLKVCHYSGNLCSYLMGENQLYISCCLTLEQLAQLKQTAANYYLDVCNECGPPFKMSNALAKKYEDPVLLSLIARKRSATLKRLELERKIKLEEEREKKNEEISMLREHYQAAIEQKQSRIAKEIEGEIKQIESHLELELKRQQLIQKEATSMIEYYSQLCETADSKKSKIEIHIKKIQNITLNQSPGRPSSAERSLSISSNESFHTVFEEPQKLELSPYKLESVVEKEHSEQQMHSSTSLDVLNANNVVEHPLDTNDNGEAISENIQQAIDNFEMARRIKEKVMNQELGIEYTYESKYVKSDVQTDNYYLTQAQKNKLKVLSSEFGITLKPEELNPTKYHSVLLDNKNKVMGVSDCFEYDKKLDNDSYLNRNLKNLDDPVSLKQSKSLTLDFEKVGMLPKKTETEKPLPMSVDSTPVSDLPLSLVTTPSTMFMSVDSGPLESIPTTAGTQQTEESFDFTSKQNAPKEIVPLYFNRNLPKKGFSKRVTKEEAAAISSNYLKLFLYESIEVPLATQTELVNEGLLNYFINEQDYVVHLTKLRDYFFLQDGEFGRNITDNLFKRLYDANSPEELINCKVLRNVVLGALDMSSKNQFGCDNLSFEVKKCPKSFDLRNPDVLDCIILTYKVEWPLNILLPPKAMAKYDEIFKFLLKLNRISWLLKKVFMEFKLLAKKTGNKEIYLMSSPNYKRLHHCRHIMVHFIQTLQNYVVGEVLHTSWELLEKNLLNVTNLDELYAAHSNYLKNILKLCFMTQKTAGIRKILHHIFSVILKFYDYLSSKSWQCEDGRYVHPNFPKLDSIFENFREIEQYFFRQVSKVSISGCHPQLVQFTELLDINGFFSKSIASRS